MSQPLPPSPFATTAPPPADLVPGLRYAVDFLAARASESEGRARGLRSQAMGEDALAARLRAEAARLRAEADHLSSGKR
jgi:hypothetical protein